MTRHLTLYQRLAAGDERDICERFGHEWDIHAAGAPAFLPRRPATPVRPATGATGPAS